MKSTPMIITALCLAAVHSVFPAPIDTRTKIDEVTVYRSGAQILRSGKIQLMQGEHDYVLRYLPLDLDANSIRVFGQGFQLQSAAHRVNFLNPGEYPPEVADLQEKKKDLELEIERKNSVIHVLTLEERMMLSEKWIPDRSESSIQEIENYMKYFREQLYRLQESKIAIKDELTRMQDELGKVDQQIGELLKQRENEGQIVLTILSDSEREVDIALGYFSPSASWIPGYDVRVSDIDQPVDLRYYAQIRQSTGEDWTGVRLSISSSQPQRYTSIPQLLPWYLRFYEIRYAKADAMQFNEEAPERAVLAESVEIRIQDELTGFNFTFTDPVTIPAGNRGRVIELSQIDLNAKYEYLTIPKLTEAVYLSAIVSGWENHYLLSGEMKIYFRNNFVSKTFLNLQSMTEDELKISLGIDDQIKVERKRNEDFSERRFLGSKRRIRTGWTVSVLNGKSKAVNVRIIDQLPISADEQIKVSTLSADGSTYLEETGELNWLVQLNSGERKEISFAYQVEFPKGKAVALEY